MSVPCAACKHELGETAGFRCRACRTARYCDAVCQQNDWPAHQPVCAELRLGRLRLSLGLAPGDEEKYARVSSRVSGIALGHGCGDTLGARVLGLPRDYWVGRGDALAQLVDGNADVARGSGALTYPDIELGQVTDVTELWIAAARGLLADRSKPRRSVSEWLRQWATTQATFVTFGLRAAQPGSRSRVLSPRDDTKRDSSAPLVRASAYAIWSWRDSGTRSLIELVQGDVSLTHTGADVMHAAVAYAIICRGLLVYNGPERALQSMDDAVAYLRGADRASKALQAIESGRNSARLNLFDPDPDNTNQAVAPSDPDTYHKSLGAVAYFLQTATRRNDGKQLWAEAIANLLAADGQANITAALVGETLAGYYGQGVLPSRVLGALVAQDARERPEWLRGQRLLYLSETLGREAS